MQDCQVEDAKATKSLVLRVSFSIHDLQYPGSDYKYLLAILKMMPTHMNSSSTENTTPCLCSLERHTVSQTKGKKVLQQAKSKPCHTEHTAKLNDAFCIDCTCPRSPLASGHPVLSAQQEEGSAGSPFGRTWSRRGSPCIPQRGL